MRLVIEFLYHAGMVKTYQLQNIGPFGEMLKIAPVTTESSSNVKTCLQVNGSAEIGVIKPQTVVPDLSQFKVSVRKYIRFQTFMNGRNLRLHD